ncbi:MAG TPA: ribosome maturation factor RimM [Gammaproteobacteria bacterium]|jgi:16S rRNA processing protein RimM|nr:ribosome maturation factor RimM [Gammaproteobacteria bacterium]
MEQNKSAVLVGKIAGAHGVQGWLKVSSFTEPPENIFGYKPWQLRGQDSTHKVELLAGKPHGKGLIVQLDGVDDRDKADQLKGMEIVVERSQLPEPGEGHYYWTDLEGLQVETGDGTQLGYVDHLIEAGAADVMVVTGSKRHLIPFVIDDTVLDVDLAAGCIRVNWDVNRQDD